LWQSILAFFEWSMEATKSETVVHLFYHEGEARWEALVLPQAGYDGMTVKLIDDHPNRIPTYQRLGRGFRPMGTVHHHCTSSAFQSGTDSNDEKTKEGLHITIGNVTHARYSIHGRVSFRNEMYDDPEWMDWFHLARPELLSFVPPKLYDDLCKHQLTTPPPKDTAFPDWWKENVIKVERAVVVTVPRNTGAVRPYQQQQHQQHQPTPGHASLPFQPTVMVRQLWLKKELRDIAEDYNMPAEELFRMIEGLADPGYADIVRALSKNDVDPEEAIEVGKALLEDEARLAAASGGDALDAFDQFAEGWDVSADDLAEEERADRIESKERSRGRDETLAEYLARMEEQHHQQPNHHHHS
jgi:hypothetical protein